eukprot:1062725-Prymnesium_polylepis.1
MWPRSTCGTPSSFSNRSCPHGDRSLVNSAALCLAPRFELQRKYLVNGRDRQRPRAISFQESSDRQRPQAQLIS